MSLNTISILEIDINSTMDFTLSFLLLGLINCSKNKLKRKESINSNDRKTNQSQTYKCLQGLNYVMA